MQSTNNGGTVNKHDHAASTSRRSGGDGEINTGKAGSGANGCDGGGEKRSKGRNKSYIHRGNVVGGEKRSLRSHDGGSRSKSELAMYFSNYEQVIALEPVKRGR